MEELTETVVPLGSLAILFAGITILFFLKKAINAKTTNKAIKNRMAEKREQKTRTLIEQKKLLEELLKK